MFWYIHINCKLASSRNTTRQRPTTLLCSIKGGGSINYCVLTLYKMASNRGQWGPMRAQTPRSVGMPECAPNAKPSSAPVSLIRRSPVPRLITCMGKHGLRNAPIAVQCHVGANPIASVFQVFWTHAPVVGALECTRFSYLMLKLQLA